MILTDNLHPSNIILKSEAKTRWDIIKDLVSLAVKTGQIAKEIEGEISQALIEREKSMSTGIGKGVAIPHCSVGSISDVVVLMATHEKGLNFDAIDSLPVKIIIVLLVPKNKLTQHIKTLANIAKIMSDDAFKEGLLGFTDPEKLFEYIRDYESGK
ncbi:MAG TPA: PTS sugar transporter subunit IIA [Spirochaetota bacterium]